MSWINVNESLPPIYQSVLLADKEHIFIGWRQPNYSRLPKWKWVSSEEEADFDEFVPTHCMPLQPRSNHMKRSTCQEIAAHHARLHYLMAEAVVAGLARSIELSHLCHRQEVDYYSSIPDLTEFPDINQYVPQEALAAFSQGAYNSIQDL